MAQPGNGGISAAPAAENGAEAQRVVANAGARLQAAAGTAPAATPTRPAQPARLATVLITGAPGAAPPAQPAGLAAVVMTGAPRSAPLAQPADLAAVVMVGAPGAVPPAQPGVAQPAQPAPLAAVIIAGVPRAAMLVGPVVPNLAPATPIFDVDFVLMFPLVTGWEVFPEVNEED